MFTCYLCATRVCSWPDFGCNGKEHMTVRVAASHQGGIHDMSTVPAEASRDFIAHMKHVAQQTPEALTDGATTTYHAFNIGIIHGGIVYHVTGMTPNQFFQARVAIPLGIDFYIGYPPASEGVSDAGPVIALMLLSASAQ